MAKRVINLPVDYMLVLQEISAEEREDALHLSHSLHINYQRMLHIIRELQHKGLVQFSSDMSIQLSRKGCRLLHKLWPQSQTIRLNY
jgi:Mn-dependent DtxR family transcriptional regulator